MTMINVHPRVLASAAIAAVLFVGCTVGPKYHAPAATPQPPPGTYKESPTQFPGSDQWKVANPQDAMLRGKWWEIYNDPELNELEEKLNVNNQNIKQAFENFMEARTLIAQAHSQLYPTIGTTPAYQRSRSSANLGNSAAATASGTGAPVATGGGQQISLFSLPVAVSWEPDLWGRIRNTIHEEQYNAQLSAADLENERLTEQASLAVFLFELRGQDALLKVFNETIDADQKSVELTRARYETGVDDQISLVQAQNALQSAVAAGTNLGVARAQFEHAIAVLIGTTASSFSLPFKPLELAPPVIPIGVPSQLLERRPDIAASERAMAAANAQIGIATAAYYPTLTLGAQGGFESSAFTKLFDWPSRFWSVGPSLSETLFDAGLRRATVLQFVALYNADVAGYRQTVLAAFQDTEDNLVSLRVLAGEITVQDEATKFADDSERIALNQYKSGIVSYLNVVTAQTTALSNERSSLTVRGRQLASSVALIKSLGGSWKPT